METEEPGYRPRIELEKDYYTASFCTFISYYKNRFQISHSEKTIYIINIIIIFFFQSTLLISLVYFMKEKEREQRGYMAMMHVNVMIPRLVCACLMHLLIAPEVRQSLAMIKYVINHKKVRGSLINLTFKVLKEKVIFLKDPTRKPSEWLYCLRANSKGGKKSLKD